MLFFIHYFFLAALKKCSLSLLMWPAGSWLAVWNFCESADFFQKMVGGKDTKIEDCLSRRATSASAFMEIGDWAQFWIIMPCIKSMRGNCRVYCRLLVICQGYWRAVGSNPQVLAQEDGSWIELLIMSDLTRPTAAKFTWKCGWFALNERSACSTQSSMWASWRNCLVSSMECAYYCGRVSFMSH